MIICPHCKAQSEEGLFCSKCFGLLKTGNANQALPQKEAEVNLPQKIMLLRKKVEVVLKKKNIDNTCARVGLVLDDTGSMTKLYNSGTMQKAVERIFAVATKFDDDGNMDTWFFANEFARTEEMTVNNYENYVNTYRPCFRTKNNEPPVMRDVFKKYTTEAPSRVPAFVIFFSDGGVKKSYPTGTVEEILIESSTYPIFWQFIGLGKSNYGALERLDTLKGRFIDNAGFFQIDDIENISDEELYDRLLNEFPVWLKEAKNKNII